MENYIGKVCPFCKTEIKEGDSVKVCPACGIPHHESCWGKNKGCTTFGCSEQHYEAQHTNHTAACQNCGAPLDKEQAFCTKCGTKANTLLSPDGNTEVTQQDNMITEKNSSKKVKIPKKLIGAGIGVVVIIIAAFAFPMIILPQINLSKARNAFDSANYISAVDYYEKSNYQNNEEDVRQYAYAFAMEQFDAASYAEAAKSFERTDNLLDSEDKIMECGLTLFEAEDYTNAAVCFAMLTSNKARSYKNYCYGMVAYNNQNYKEAAKSFGMADDLLDSKNKISDCGFKLLEAEDYANASGCFALIPSVEAQAYKNYCDGIVSYNKKNYDKALSQLTLAEPVVNSAAAFLPQVYFEYGKSLFDNAEYSEAKTQFEKAGDYSEAPNYATASALLELEDLFKTGHFAEAANAYDKLPHDFTFNGVNYSQRYNDIKNMSAFSAISGKWTVTQNYIESRHVYKRDGSWNSWYHNEPLDLQSLDIHCYLNDDGTVKIKGYVSFYRFTDYSTINKYCTATQTTKFFTIDNVNSIPASYAIDDDTTLKYANGIFSISYSVRDNYSANFYNLYNSSVTYGKRTEVY